MMGNGVKTTVVKSYYDHELGKTILSGTEIEVSADRVKVLLEKGFITAGTGKPEQEKG